MKIRSRLALVSALLAAAVALPVSAYATSTVVSATPVEPVGQQFSLSATIPSAAGAVGATQTFRLPKDEWVSLQIVTRVPGAAGPSLLGIPNVYLDSVTGKAFCEPAGGNTLRTYDFGNNSGGNPDVPCDDMGGTLMVYSQGTGQDCALAYAFGHIPGTRQFRFDVLNFTDASCDPDPMTGKTATLEVTASYLATD